MKQFSLFVILSLFCLNASLYSMNPSEHSSKEDLHIDLALTPYANAITGHDLFLRPVFPDDYPAFVPSYANADHMKYFGTGRIFSESEVKELVSFWALKSKNNPIYHYQRWSAIDRNGIQGSICIYKSNELKGYLEIFGSTNPNSQNKDYATEAATLIINSVHHSFMATIHPNNKASLSVLEKLGFEKDPNRQDVAKYESTRNYYLLDFKNPEDFIPEKSMFFHNLKK